MRYFEAFLVAIWAAAFVNLLLNLALIPRLGSRVSGLGSRVSGLGSQVSGLGSQIGADGRGRGTGSRDSASPETGDPTPETARPAHPLVSVIIPARNEERAIGETVRRFLAQDYPNFEVIAVNDRSGDRTGDILEELAGDPRLRVIRGEDPPPGWLGKPWALEQGCRAARGEVILLVDADIHYEPGALSAAVAELHRTGAAMVTVLPYFEMHGLAEHAVLPQLGITLFMVLPAWLGQRFNIQRLGVGGGTGNLVWRDALEAIGGYAALRDAVVDDVGLAQHLRGDGRRTAIANADHLISLRMYHGTREVMDGFTKNMFTIIGRSYVAGVLVVAWTIATNMLPWFLALRGDVLAIVTVGIITLSRVVLYRFLRYPMWSALFLHLIGSAMWMWILLRSMWVTGIRRRVVWRGRSYDQSWSRFGSGR